MGIPVPTRSRPLAGDLRSLPAALGAPLQTSLLPFLGMGVSPSAQPPVALSTLSHTLSHSFLVQHTLIHAQIHTNVYTSIVIWTLICAHTLIRHSSLHALTLIHCHMCTYTLISLYLYIHMPSHLSTLVHTHIPYLHVLTYTHTYACTHLSLTSWEPVDLGPIQAKGAGSWERQVGGATGRRWSAPSGGPTSRRLPKEPVVRAQPDPLRASLNGWGPLPQTPPTAWGQAGGRALQG